MLNHRDTVISQYANSPTILQLIDSMNGYIDPRADLAGFYDYVWNIETAQGFGLDVWGKIVGVSRTFRYLGDQDCFGFEEGVVYQPFDQAPFFTSELYTVVNLDDDDYRRLILIKALANISRMNAKTINILLRQLFDGRRCYVMDLGGMKMRYVFEFVLTNLEYAMFAQSGAVPRPAGVDVSIVMLAPTETFGFDGSGLQPFDQGVLYSPTI